jgi:AcrR family transcriptional regulator
VSPSRAYPGRREIPSKTRAQIVAAVRELLEAGTFHETSVEDVAVRAGVSRATVYQHFGSRLGLVDAMCETFGRNEALRTLKEAVDVEDFLARVVEFWASEEKVLVELYGVAAVDPAARDLVERQRRDRYGVVRRLVAGMRLPRGLREEDAFVQLAMLSSFETYLELRRHTGLAKRDVVEALLRSARGVLATA